MRHAEAENLEESDMSAVPLPEAWPQCRRKAEKSTDLPLALYSWIKFCKTEDQVGM
jgi:hypothetical protein